MSDLDLLTGAIAARIRALDEVERLYPSKQKLLGVPVTGIGVLTALAADDTIAAETRDGILHLEVTLAVDGDVAAAPHTLRVVADLIHDQLDLADVQRRQVTVRVASITR